LYKLLTITNEKEQNKEERRKKKEGEEVGIGKFFLECFFLTSERENRTRMNRFEYLRVLLNELLELISISTHKVLYKISSLEELEAGDGRDIGSIWKSLKFIDIDMNENSVRMLLGELFEDGSDSLAWSTPVGRKVNDDLRLKVIQQRDCCFCVS